MLVVVSALPALSQTIALSGTVKDSGTGNGLSGATVSLAMAKITTTTGADGSWSLAHSTPTNIGLRSGSSRAVSSHLSLQEGRVVLRFDGHDVLGHGARGASAPHASTASLARSGASVVDTLLVSWKDSIRVRQALTSYLATDLRLAFDTSSRKLDTGHFTDARDGQTYTYTKIGSQTWMAQNLNYRNTTGSTDTVGVCSNNSADSCVKYGRLYTWAQSLGLNDTCDKKTCTSLVAEKQRGICPASWHVPSDEEWTTMQRVVDANAYWVTSVDGTKLKARGAWRSNSGTDMYGFRALPGGHRSDDGFYDQGDLADFWTASEVYEVNAWHRYFYDNYAYGFRSDYTKTLGLSLRCLQD